MLICLDRAGIMLEGTVVELFYKTIANPTAPPNTPTASQPQLLDLGAIPDCNPAAGPVVLTAAPAEPVGVGTPVSLAWITVTAVIVD